MITLFYYFLTDESFNGNKTKQTTGNTATVAPLISSNPDRSEFVLHLGSWPEHTTTVQSPWWGCSINCFWGFRFSCCIFLASDGNTASTRTEESILLVLKELQSVLHSAGRCEHSSHSLGLIWLGPIGKDHVHYHDKHTVLVWMNNAGSVLGQIDEVMVGVARELNSID